MIRVLVVDDDFRVARIHVGFVQRVPGFEVVGVAHSGAEALVAVEELAPDLLLLDLYLPDRFGLDLLADVHAGSHPCDAIVITAAKEGDAVRAAIRLGVTDYLLKPFGFADLEDRLRRYEAQRAVLARAEVSDQSDIDRALSRNATRGGSASVPKGLSPETARLVQSALREASGPLSATDVAEVIGVSRVSARRYLEHFASRDEAVVRLRYGSTGRPERLYEWTG
ncbi:response regulator [Phycicoccus sp. HDW14]|uniref:response regulator n=1 Tax=Phycicoccus sp. HDW14 TaxID=2714941 RepID=UPI00140D9962|nr:response regulator [Phycicoccus sp. HDW14]QIM22619.1 response regulator [Phycicoccus sp. HDW14]